ncbi:RagB/SusD family nutrient uptake outer membrane protein [Chitinophaga sp. Cy-1792]|uniref:RagB/SusD family nutrient uptake outer membrane protein n=1 Tax=Chitinophaga sp. Cy-1792 TaxID=2608339 RepID=UPI00141EBC76|nr:RagB/SusD family nutrient uptake outer membrane protein [Chitinophaga sp. Cy-1792]NIG55869.1 RagB/SusD family nutrient uptake outer membrane protein [Chitinophaga sp. Cy-1792]
MKKIVILLISISVVAGLSSCHKFLDIKPKGYTIPQYYEDYAKLMNSMDLVRVSAAYPNYLTDDAAAGEDNDVTVGASYLDMSDYKKALYSFQPGAVFSAGSMDPLWEPAYSHIYTYNIVINNIMAVPDATDGDKKQLRAEALVGRALEFLNLVNAYAKHYDPATAATDYGIPLVLSEDINASYKRNTVQEVYDKIKADLEEGLKDLPTKPKNIFRPSKSVGYSFLSRMYLYMGRYDDALSNARSALALNNNLLDYTLYTNIDGITFGRVCLTSDNTQRFPDANLSSESIWVKLGSASSSSVNAAVYASDDLQQAFGRNLPANATDMRWQLFFCHGQSAFGLDVVKFPGRHLYAPYIDFNLGLSSGEIYLVAAECEARVGDKDQALKYLDAIRNKRIKNNQPLVAASKDEALQLALDERRREMCLVGCTRLIDLKRLNKDPRFAKTVTHKRGTVTYTLAPNDNKYILPVPPKVLEFNHDMPLYER